MHWSPDDLVEIITACLKQRVKDDDLEQCVYGFDSWKELKIHKLLEDAFSNTKLGVWREVKYPIGWGKIKKSEGIRCDFVFTPRKLPLKDPELTGTLFGVAIDAATPEESYWLEIKLVREFDQSMPNRRYASDLKHVIKKDIIKIWQDDRLKHGGLLLLLYTHDSTTGDRDVDAWYEHIRSKGLPISPPIKNGFKITDRTGNGWCTVALISIN